MEFDLTNDQRARLESGNVTSTEIRDMAKEIGRNHSLGLKLWERELPSYRLLAILLMDKAQVPELIDKLLADIEKLDVDSQEKLADWLMANQIMNLKERESIIGNWINDSSVVKQIMFWSYHARVIRKDKIITKERVKLLDVIELRIQKAEPPVQWNMNYCAAQMGIFDEALRQRCIGLGEQTGLYKDYKVSKGCTSPYLPSWINSEVRKNAGRT